MMFLFVRPMWVWRSTRGWWESTSKVSARPWLSGHSGKSLDSVHKNLKVRNEKKGGKGVPIRQSPETLFIKLSNILGNISLNILNMMKWVLTSTCWKIKVIIILSEMFLICIFHASVLSHQCVEIVHILYNHVYCLFWQTYDIILLLWREGFIFSLLIDIKNNLSL